MATDPDAAASPLMLDHAARLLAATVLTVFPNTTQPTPVPDSARDPIPAALRQAVAFIHDHAGQDISIGDIAIAASLTSRAVQLSFRRHLDTTPTAYLRQIRLARAHADLLAADEGDGQTVTRVAFRWNFSSSSRFTSYYRAAYGITPSQVLGGGG